jgi:hypothetical protein
MERAVAGGSAAAGLPPLALHAAQQQQQQQQQQQEEEDHPHEQLSEQQQQDHQDHYHPPTAPFRLGRETKARAAALVRRAETKAWAGARGKGLAPPPKLHPAILRTVREWCVANPVQLHHWGPVQLHPVLMYAAEQGLACSIKAGSAPQKNGTPMHSDV